MKSVFISYNQAFTERVEYMLDKLEIRGFTQWENVHGRGSNTGDPHMGTHTWPETNSAVLTVIDNEKVDTLLEKVQKLNTENEEIGIRAFVWNIERTV